MGPRRRRHKPALPGFEPLPITVGRSPLDDDAGNGLSTTGVSEGRMSAHYAAPGEDPLSKSSAACATVSPAVRTARVRRRYQQPLRAIAHRTEHEKGCSCQR
jgi:hypothetical protein